MSPAARDAAHHLIACVQQLLDHIQPLLDNITKEKAAPVHYSYARIHHAAGVLARYYPTLSLQRIPVRGSESHESSKPGSGSEIPPSRGANPRRYDPADTDAVQRASRGVSRPGHLLPEGEQ